MTMIPPVPMFADFPGTSIEINGKVEHRRRNASHRRAAGLHRPCTALSPRTPPPDFVNHVAQRYARTALPRVRRFSPTFERKHVVPAVRFRAHGGVPVRATGKEWARRLPRFSHC